MTQQIAPKQLEQDIRVIIVEDYKLTRVGLRFALNEIENINVIAEAQNAETGLEIIKREPVEVTNLIDTYKTYEEMIEDYYAYGDEVKVIKNKKEFNLLKEVLK